VGLRGNPRAKLELMLLYVKTDDAPRWRERMELEVRGRLAIHRLQLERQRYCGFDTSGSESRLKEARWLEFGNRAAPAGTYCRYWAPGLDDWIWIVDEFSSSTVYLGPREGYGP
jgi:hypothetical protein